MSKHKKTKNTPEPKAAKVMGRPRKEFSWVEFEKLCAMQCTQEEIMAFFEVSLDTLQRRCTEQFGTTFAQVYDQKRQAGRTSLRRNMFLSAQSGNTTMQIFLSKQKQFLGFSDRVEQHIDHTLQARAKLQKMTDEEIQRESEALDSLLCAPSETDDIE